MINPVDPSKPTGGEGKEKYDPDLKRGPGKFDTALEEAKRRFKEIAEEGRKQGDIKKQYWDINPPKGGGGGSGAMSKSNRDITKNYKKGGTASSRADGIAKRGRTRA
jgi:hypothetical protein